MPSATKEQGKDRAARVAVEASKALQAKQQQVQDALREAPAARHVEEKRRLTMAHEKLLDGRSTADRRRAEPTRAEQTKQLERIQRAELELAREALEASKQLAERPTPTGPGRAQTDAAAVLDRSTDRIRGFRERAERHLAADRTALDQALAADATRRAEPLEELTERVDATSVSLDRDVEMVRAEIERAAVLATNRRDAAALADLRAEALNAAGENENVARALRDDAVVQRLADEALVPGKQRVELDTPASKEAAVQRVKGELAEVLAAVEYAREVIARENAKRAADQQLFLIEGNRIRDEQGNKLSDGIIAWRDRDNALRVWEVLEVKAGPASARELNRHIEELTKAAERELRAYARDLAREELEELEKGASTRLEGPARSQEIDRLAAIHEERLRSHRTQVESGQREKTAERVDLTTRLYVDGLAEEMKRDETRRLSELVAKVVTRDALRRDEQAAHLAERAKDLEAIARAFVEELLRKRSP